MKDREKKTFKLICSDTIKGMIVLCIVIAKVMAIYNTGVKLKLQILREFFLETRDG
jgi:hypothetical protein